MEGNTSMKMDIGVPNAPSGEIRIAEELTAYNDALQIRIQEALDEYAVILLDRLADLTPIETGETARSWEVFTSKWQIFITNSNEPVATFLSEGTVGHWVEPVTAKALHWIGPSGQDFFSKGHMVTGITPLFIEWNALEQTQGDLDALLDQAESQAFDDAFERNVNVQSPQTGDSGGADLGGDASDEGGYGDGGSGGEEGD